MAAVVTQPTGEARPNVFRYGGGITGSGDNGIGHGAWGKGLTGEGERTGGGAFPAILARIDVVGRHQLPGQIASLRH